MDAVLERQLDENETLLWSGRPSSRRAALAANVPLILSFIFGAVGIVLFILGSIFLSIPGSSPAPFILFTIGSSFLLVTVILAIVGFIIPRFSRNYIYAITDQRVIIIRAGSVQLVQSYSKNDLGPIIRIERPDGTGDLIFALPRYIGNYSYNYSYQYSYGGSSTGTSSYSGMYGIPTIGRFVAISNVRQAERILRETFR